MSGEQKLWDLSRTTAAAGAVTCCSPLPRSRPAASRALLWVEMWWRARTPSPPALRGSATILVTMAQAADDSGDICAGGSHLYPLAAAAGGSREALPRSPLRLSLSARFVAQHIISNTETALDARAQGSPGRRGLQMCDPADAEPSPQSPINRVTERKKKSCQRGQSMRQRAIRDRKAGQRENLPALIIGACG